jgi:succinate-acetate transporter protein
MCPPTDKTIPDGSDEVETSSHANGSGPVRRRNPSKPPLADDSTMPVDRLVRGLRDLAQHVHPPVPNPAPLGLIAFGFTTCLLQMKHTRLTGSDPEDAAGVNALVLGFAMFFGGLLQIIAGLSEIRRNNIFGYTAFCVYGGFWMSLGTANIVSLLATNTPPTNVLASQAMLFLLGVTSFMLWVPTFQLNKTICSLFFLLMCTCFLLSFGTRNETVDVVGGYFGIVTSANAFWLAFVELVNDVVGHGVEILPLFHWHWTRQQIRGTGGAMHVPGRIRGHTIGQLYISEAKPSSRSQATNGDEVGADYSV